MTIVVDPQARHVPVSRSERAERARRDVAEAALRLVEQAGYGAMTIDAVAVAAGVSPRSVHRYFRTKGELFADAVNAPSRDFLLAVDEALTDRPIEEAVWQAVLQTSPYTHPRHRSLVVTLTTDPEVRTRWLGRMDEHQRTLARILHRHASADQPELFWLARAGAVLSGLVTALSVWAVEDPDSDLEQLVTSCIRFTTSPKV